MRTRQTLFILFFAGLLLFPLAASASGLQEALVLPDLTKTENAEAPSAQNLDLGLAPLWLSEGGCSNWAWSWSSTHAGYCANSAGPDCAGGTCGQDGNGRFQFISGDGVCSCFCCTDDYLE